MRKRSKYKPRPVMLDTMAWVKEGFQPITTKTDDNLRLRLRNATALDSIIHGNATVSDLDELIAVSNMTTALARKYGQDWREEIRAAADAIEAMQKRFYTWRKVQATPSELEAVKLLYRIHDAQLDACRVRDIDEGVRIARAGSAGVQIVSSHPSTK